VIAKESYRKLRTHQHLPFARRRHDFRQAAARRVKLHSPLSFGKSFMKIRSAVPENGCLIVLVDGKEQKTLSTNDSVCLSVCHTKLQTASSFFVSQWNRSIFGHQFSMTPSTKRCSSIFDLGPLTPKIYFPKFAQNCL